MFYRQLLCCLHSSKPTDTPKFEVHTLAAFTEPVQDITASTAKTDYPRIATLWINYLVSLQDNLKITGVTGVLGTLTTDQIELTVQERLRA